MRFTNWVTERTRRGHQPGGRTVRSWPLALLAVPAAVAVWSGWVGIGQMTGFGMVRPLPGIADSVRIDTAVTLPVGVEAYAAFALHAWLSGTRQVSDPRRTRRFARWSAIGSLGLGMAGQVVYHLLAQAGVVRAPWGVTTLVACLPVLVLGMGAALAHMLQADACAADQSGIMPGPGLLAVCGPQPGRGRTSPRAGPAAPGPGAVGGGPAGGVRRPGVPAGLRAAGVRGSNAELGTIARMISRQS